jgi:uncharacterized protein YbdZ (MbtH family)
MEAAPDVGFKGTRAECPDRIEAVWTDIQRLSLG